MNPEQTLINARWVVDASMAYLVDTMGETVAYMSRSKYHKMRATLACPEDTNGEDEIR